jgi:hypothetical protein
MMREGGREGGREEGEMISVFLVSSSWNRSLWQLKFQKGEEEAFKNSPESRLQKTLQLQWKCFCLVKWNSTYI